MYNYVARTYVYNTLSFVSVAKVSLEYSTQTLELSESLFNIHQPPGASKTVAFLFLQALVHYSLVGHRMATRFSWRSLVLVTSHYVLPTHGGSSDLPPNSGTAGTVEQRVCVRDPYGKLPYTVEKGLGSVCMDLAHKI